MTKDEQDARQTDLYLGRVAPTPGDMFEAFVAERGRAAGANALANNELGQAQAHEVEDKPRKRDLAGALELSDEEQASLAAIVAPFEAVLPKHRNGRKHPPMLKVNERVRLEPGGTVYRVVRVNACAAYIRPAYSQPKLVEFGSKSFTANEGGSLIAISPFSFVYREEV